MPARNRAAEQARRLRQARRAQLAGAVPAPAPARLRAAQEAEAWRDHEQGDECARRCR